MKKLFICGAVVLGFISSNSNAQTTTRSFQWGSGDPETLCRMPNTDQLPQCIELRNRQNSSGNSTNYDARRDPFRSDPPTNNLQRNEQPPFPNFDRPNGQTEEATIPSGVSFSITNMPETLARPEWPAFWVKVCRNGDNPPGGQVISYSDGFEAATNLLTCNCSYVAFKHSLRVKNDTTNPIKITYQFLGRY